MATGIDPQCCYIEWPAYYPTQTWPTQPSTGWVRIMQPSFPVAAPVPRLSDDDVKRIAEMVVELLKDGK